MKRCSRCKETKEYDCFAKKSVSRDGYAVWCKECFKDYDRERYANGDKARKDKNKKDRLAKVRKSLWEYLRGSKCFDCGNRDPEVLEFDHLVPSEKRFNISEMLRDYAWETILVEIRKCDVVCANCHRKRTIQQLGWWRGNQINGL